MRSPVTPGSRKNQEGSVIIIVMIFAFVLTMIGVGLFFLLNSSNASVALERKDVKAFNVAEAGVDSAMVELRSGWPREAGADPTVPLVYVDPTEFRALYDEKEFPDPTHDQFIQAITYDDTGDNPTSVPANRVYYDSNQNKIMWVDSEALVDNARHRILVKVQRLTMPVQIPDMALAASYAGGNAHGLNVEVDPDYTGSIPDGGAEVRYIGKAPDMNAGVNPGANIDVVADAGFDFSQYVPDSLIGVLMQLAKDAGSYFDDSNTHAEVAAYLCNETTGPGSMVYYKTDVGGELEFAGAKSDMGTPELPLVFVVDARGASGTTTVDLRGNGDFHGVLIVLGNVLLRGTSRQPTGCVLCEGSVENKGGPSVRYNGDYIRKLNDMYTLSVAMVPNSWEEYTIAK